MTNQTPQSKVTSEDEKDTKGSSTPAGLTSEPMKMGDSGKNEENEKHRLMRKHWRPNKAWFILVFLGLGACWIPAILEWTKFPGARVWGVRLFFWSIWLSILWAGWWFALVISWIWHRLLLIFVHVFNFYRLERYVNWLEYLHGYLALFAWAAALWITWVPLIADRQLGNNGQDSNSRSVRAINLGGRLFFALAGCTAILLCEKTAIQWIAMKFHERSYKRRIDAQKEAVRAFKALYSLVKGPTNSYEQGVEAQKKLSRRIPSQWSTNSYITFSSRQEYNYNLHLIDRTPTSRLQTAFTDVTKQIFGTSQVESNDVVSKAFHRDASTRMEQLAREIWSGLVEGSQASHPAVMRKSTIEARRANLTDQHVDQKNTDITTDKIWNVLTGGIPHVESINEEDFTTRCSELHAEGRRLEETMNDLQNVVGRLDDLLMMFWVIGCVLIIAVALETELKTLIFGAGSAFVGISWLIKDTACEILASIVFLFSKHPFDVDDMVIINGKNYTVKEMRLLSTVFHGDGSIQVQAPNSLLNTMFILNLRRSPATSEPFTIDISDQTTEEQLEIFRSLMVAFLKEHPKDYRDEFEVLIKELSTGSQKMVLCLEIKYNNNWESEPSIRAKRRNAWICCVRKSLQDAGIQGPGTPSLRLTTSDSTNEEATETK
ncbi:hypothetical protein AN958_03831 [Leucoagaricus sp. SymC.cos]|nr:hypothetical protein AN958_03831 [Leucoagaricus sp. SymC.cos]